MATNMYLKFENPSINASSTADGHQGEIEVLSWSHGFVQPTSPTRSSAGSGTGEQATHSNFNFTKYLDGTTNELLRFTWSGKQIGKATLKCYRASDSGKPPVEYLEVVMEHVIISNYSVSGGPGDVPVENISLDYGIVQYNYKEQRGGSPARDLGILPVRHDLETRQIS